LHTLRARLVFAATSAILVAVGLFAGAAVLLVQHELRGTLDQALRQRGEQVGELAVSAPAVLTQPGALESPVSGRQLAVEVIDARGRLLARSTTLGSRLLPQGALATAAIRNGSSGFQNFRLDGRPFRLYAAPIAQAGGPAAGGAVLVASDTTDIDHTVGRLGLLLGLSGAGAALLAAIAAAVLTTRGLIPLRRLAGAAGEIERTADPARRLPSSPTADEVEALTGVLNRMLSSLDEARSSERRFLADASHELRTPVTALRGNVEYVVRHGATPEVLADLRHDAERLARLVDDLLVLERAVATGTAGKLEPVDLEALVRDLTAGRERVSLDAPEPAWVLADRDSLSRAIGNLIENALIHGPNLGAVTVGLRASGGEARVTVSDEGPGPPPEDSERIFERFWRGSAAPERTGSGLGLSIVDAIVRRHRGRIAVDGSAFSIELPLVPQPPGSPRTPGNLSTRA
jgi:signal transduction histidine kinase